MNHELFASVFANPAGSPIRQLFPYLSRPGLISFAGGYPSRSLLDAEGLQEAAARAFAAGGSTLRYLSTEGTLKQELLEPCSRRRMHCRRGELLVTTGSQQAFAMAVTSMLRLRRGGF